MEELPPLNVLLTHLNWNLQRMAEMETQARTEYFRNAALQRYGFTFDSALRCIKAYAREQHESCESAEECLRLADSRGWLPQGTDWVEMLDSYVKMQPDSLAQHGDSIFEKLKTYHDTFHTLYKRMAGRS